MIGDLVKRVFNGAVLFLAALTFFLVPVGTKTPAQHLVAIFSTKPAREAGAAFADAGRRAADRARKGLADLASGPRAAPPDAKVIEAAPAPVITTAAPDPSLTPAPSSAPAAPAP